MKSKKNNLNILYVICAMIGTFICIFMHNTQSIPYYIIPLSYAIALILFRRYNKFSFEISILIIDLLMVVRYVILPVSYYFSGGMPIAFSVKNQQLGILLMIYEMVAVMITVSLFAPYLLSKKIQNNKYKKIRNNVGVGSFIIILLFLVILILHPQYLKNLFTFKFGDFSAIEMESNVDGMYNLIYKTGIIALCCLVLSKFSKYKKKKNIHFIIALIFSWISVWMTSVGTSGMVSRTSFLTNGIIFTLLVLKNFPEKKKIILFSSFAVVFIMLFLGTVFRFYSASSTSAVTNLLSYETLDSYFGGLRDVTVGLAMRENYNDSINFGTFITDFFAGAPYFASRSNLNFDNRIPVYFNNTFFGFSGVVSRICPIIIQGASYFTVFLAPIFSCICVTIALKCNKAIKQNNSSIEIYFFALGLYYFATYSMYNINIIMGGIWNKLLPIFFVIILDRIKIKNGIKWRKF
mgnify:CR=1 FL=1